MVGIIYLLAFIVLNDDLIKWKENVLFCLIIVGIICFVLTAYLVVKYLIPAIKGQIAIVIDKNCIIDNIRNITIQWDNVRAIRSLSSSGSEFIAIDLKRPQEITSQRKNVFKKISYASSTLFYRTPILIPTQLLVGCNSEIINQLLVFSNRKKLLETGVLCNQV